MTGAEEFLAACWGSGWHSLCIAPRDGAWFGAVGCFDDPGELLDEAAKQTALGHHVWWGVHPLAKRLNPPAHGGNDDVDHVQTLVADLDWQSDAHKDNAKLKPEAEVRSAVKALGELRPSGLIDTGHGLQAYWPLSLPVTPDEGVALTARLHAHIAALAPECAALSTVLRVPGSFNWKLDPVEVRIIEADLERAFNPHWLDKRLPSLNGHTGHSAGGTKRWSRTIDWSTVDPATVEAWHLLEKLGGHSPYKNRAGDITVVRPGKIGGNGATVGYIGPGVVKCFTPGWPPLRDQAVYNLDDLEALVNGDTPPTDDDLADELAGEQKAKARRPDGEWGDPVPLPGTGDTRQFPTAVLGSSASYVAAAAEATTTPVDLAAMSALGAVSTVVAGSVVVSPAAGWLEPVNLYELGIAAPGEGKSPVLAEVTFPLAMVQKERREAMMPEIIEAEAQKRIAEGRRKRAEDDAAKRGLRDDGRMDAEAEAMAAARDAASMEVPSEPRLSTRDATPEGLTRLLAEQGGRLAVLSDEGADFFELASRYSASGKGNLDIYLAGWDGRSYDSDRAGRDPIHIDRVTLTVLLMAQPVVLSDLGKDRQARGRGLLARFLWVSPRTKVGRRSTEPPPIPEHLRDEWGDLVVDLARQALRVEGDPLVLRLDPNAAALYRQWRAKHEPRLLADVGDLSSIVEWAAKLHGQVLRLAGVLHAMRTGAIAGIIGADTMESALDLSDYYVDHALAVFGRMGADEVTEDAALALRWLVGRGPSEVRTQDVSHSKAWPAERTRAALVRLADYGWVRHVAAKPGPGRPSERWDVYPRITGEN